MKKILLLTTMFIAIASLGFGQGLAGSGHDFIDDVSTDFADDSWNTSASNAMCGPCHVPHNANGLTGAPLWSHATSAAAGTFTLYAGTNMDATDLGQPTGTSLMCLSCHDGSTALNNHLSAGAADATVFVNGDQNFVGTNLQNDHPVSFTYDATLFGNDPGLNDPAGAAVAALLFSGKVECSSCHDPHDDGGFTGMLRADNTNSQLCLTCHNK